MRTADPEPQRRMALGHVVLMVFIQVAWGVNILAAKFSLAEIPPLFFTALRFGAVALIYLPWVQWHPRRFKVILLIAFSGGALHFGLFFLGLAYAGDIAPVAIAIQLNAPFATILSFLVLGERARPHQIVALALAFGGVMVIAYDPRVVEYLWPLLLVCAAALAWATGAMLMRRTTDLHVFDLQGWIALVTFPAVGLASFVLETGQLESTANASTLAWVGLVYTVFGGAIFGHAGLNWLIHRYQVAQIAPFMLLSPVVGGLLGVWLLGDVLTWRMVVGGALTLGGVLLVTTRPRHIRLR